MLGEVLFHTFKVNSFGSRSYPGEPFSAMDWGKDKFVESTFSGRMRNNDSGTPIIENGMYSHKNYSVQKTWKPLNPFSKFCFPSVRWIRIEQGLIQWRPMTRRHCWTVVHPTHVHYLDFSDGSDYIIQWKSEIDLRD